jgi:hypothetical protein
VKLYFLFAVYSEGRKRKAKINSVKAKKRGGTEKVRGKMYEEERK